jgi:DNA-binding IclR family transcriptional regulator
MAVKTNQSASRVLTVLETIAKHQPVGVSELARLLGADKSALQRSLTTLAHEEWIHAAPTKPTRWELTARIHTIAQLALGTHELRYRARAALEALRDKTGETVLLIVPERGRFVVIDVQQSRQPLRIVPDVGTVIWTVVSATGRSILPFMPRAQQIEYLGGQPNAAQIEDFATTVAQGYAISINEVVRGSANFAAPIFEVDGQPVAIVLVSAPSDRVALADYHRVGITVAETARELSRGPAPRVQFSSQNHLIAAVKVSGDAKGMTPAIHRETVTSGPRRQPNWKTHRRSGG